MVSKPLIAQGYSLAEEIANSISHGIGLVFGIVGLVLLLVQAVDANASAMAITSYSLYGGSMILLFLASTLYHAIPHQRAKIWLKKFDHCAIYLLIAGTYTPFLLVGLGSPLARNRPDRGGDAAGNGAFSSAGLVAYDRYRLWSLSLHRQYRRVAACA
jgi:hemolysin III